MPPQNILDLDEKLLKQAELAEYQRITAIKSVPIIGIGLLIACIATAVIISVASLGSQAIRSAEGDQALIEIVLTLVVIGLTIIGGWLTFTLPLGRKDAAMARYRRELSGFKDRIGYERRARLARSSSGSAERDDYDDRPRYPITGNYDPRRYYSYSKSQREYMLLTGMDADTYDANVEGSEY